MIVLENLTKIFSMHGHRKVVADNINATFPTGASVALIGANGAGKSTLLKLIAGTSSPTWGRVLSTGSVSFPVGLASSLHSDLTGAQNTRFVARIYGADTEGLAAWVEEFAELGAHFHLPVRSYSSGMRGRLSFGINMGLAFDTYLVDEITAVGDAAFKRKSAEVFHTRMRTSGAIYVSHSMGSIRELCQSGALLEGGRLHYYPDVEEAIERYVVSLDPGRAHPVRTPASKRAIPRFPDDSRMLFAMGLPETRADWLVECLRGSRAGYVPREGAMHYFDLRAGLNGHVARGRSRLLRELAASFDEETGRTRRQTLRRMNEITALLRMHGASGEDASRHDDYVACLTERHSGQTIVCDATADYALLGAEAFAEMALVGDAVFCVTLRDPVDRIWASVCLQIPEAARTPETCAASARELVSVGYDAALARKPHADYARLMAALDAAVPAARRVVTFHERLADPDTAEAEIARLIAACGATERFDRDRPAPEPEPPMPPLPPDLAAALEALLAPQYAAMRARFGDALPETWRDPGPEAAAAPIAAPRLRWGGGHPDWGLRTGRGDGLTGPGGGTQETKGTPP